jgi:DNA mismatch repair ATPase MutS
MRLDAAAQRALNVFPLRGDASSSFSLLGLLGRTRTPMGKRRLKVWRQGGEGEAEVPACPEGPACPS